MATVRRMWTMMRGNRVSTGAAPTPNLLTNDAGTNLLFDDAVTNQLVAA